MNFEYIPKPIKKLKSDFSRRSKKVKSPDSFKDFNDFCKWYQNQKKECFYCGLTEKESQKIVKTGILKSKRFPQNGILKRGQSRGFWLEIDRFDPQGGYTESNCRLCCYFCNNDKSDVFDGNAYEEFMKNRVGYLRKLLLDNGNR